MVLHLAERFRGTAVGWRDTHGKDRYEEKPVDDDVDTDEEQKEEEEEVQQPVDNDNRFVPEPLLRLKSTVKKISTSAKDQTKRVYSLATDVLHGIAQLAPEFSVPTLGDVEKLTTAFITISSRGDTVTVSRTSSSNSPASRHDDMIVISHSGFEELQFSNEKVNEILHSTLRFLAEARTSTPSQVICKLIVHVTKAVGANLDPEYKSILQNLVGESFSESRQSGVQHGGNGSFPLGQLNPGTTLTSTGLLLSYRERDDPLPWSKSRKIQRSMHYKMPLRPFQATIFIPAVESDVKSPINDAELVPALRRSCTPQSFPASPHLRSRVLSGFTTYTDDLLYRARDELRISKVEDEEHMDQSSELPIIASFNPGDVHPDISLSCGNHCASRSTDGPHRSVRATAPVLPNYPIYFEFNCVHCENSDSTNSQASEPATQDDQVPSVCVGLSTLNARLGFLVGSKRYSIGMSSSGHLVSGSLWMKGHKDGPEKCDASFAKGGIVGVLVQIIEDEFDLDDQDDPEMVTVLTNFFIDGEPVLGLPDQLLEMRIPIDVDVYPTVSLSSSSTKVFGYFSADDVVYGSPSQLSPFTAQESVYALDGSCIYHESCLY